MSDIVERTYRFKLKGDIAALDDIENRIQEILEESAEEFGTHGTLKMADESPVGDSEDFYGDEEDYDED